MKNQNLEMKLCPVGTAYRAKGEDTMRIVIYPKYIEGLDGIENLDYIYVLYWMNRLSEKDRKILKVHPQGNMNRPLRGVFSLHSSMRPNPIGLTRVKLIERKGNTLFVKGLDALDGSPIIDIKSG